MKWHEGYVENTKTYIYQRYDNQACRLKQTVNGMITRDSYALKESKVVRYTKIHIH